MKTIPNILGIITLLAVALVGCKVDDPFVDRVVSPVLVDIVGAPFGAPFATEPTVSYPINGKVVLKARILELDKTNLLDHTKGIDSLPVRNIPMKLMLRNGVVVGEATSDAQGVVTFEKTWAELGLNAPRSGNIIRVSWSGTHKGITFTRLSQVRASQ